jgi:hypothetical protein
LSIQSFFLLLQRRTFRVEPLGFFSQPQLTFDSASYGQGDEIRSVEKKILADCFSASELAKALHQLTVDTK